MCLQLFLDLANLALRCCLAVVQERSDRVSLPMLMTMTDHLGTGRTSKVRAE
jgi:hypothetical protein